MRGAVEAPLPRAWPRCDSPLSAAGERRREGGRRRERGRGRGGSGGRGTRDGRAGGRAAAAARAPGGRVRVRAGALPPLPGRGAGRGCCAAVGGRASGRAGGRAELLERPTLLRVPLTPTRGSALPFYPAPSRPPGKPGTERGAGAGRGTDSLPSPHKGGGESTGRGGRRSAAFARQPQRRRLRGKPGPEPAPLRSPRRLPRALLSRPVPSWPRREERAA